MRVRLLVLVCAFGLMSSMAAAQDGGVKIGCLFANNDTEGANTVSRYEARDNGTLVLMPPPTPTGGAGVGGGYFANNRAELSADELCLFVPNPGSNTVTAFAVDVTTCDLSSLGTVPSGGIAGGLGMGLAFDAVGNRLYALNPGSNNVHGFDVGPDCTLTSIGPSVPGAPGTDTPDDLIVDPAGSYVTATAINQDRLESWDIDPITGTLSGAAGCFPCPPATGPDSFIAGMEFDSSGTRLFAGKANFNFTRVNVFAFDPPGGSPNIAGSPFAFSLGSNSNIVKLADGCLLATNQASNTLASMTVGVGGSLTPLPPVHSLGPGDFPTDMEFGCLNKAGSYPLWIANGNPRTVKGLLWAACGSQTNVGAFPTGVPGAFLLRGIAFAAQDPLTCIKPSKDVPLRK